VGRRREEKWAEFIKWDWKMDMQYEWDDDKGLVLLSPSKQAQLARTRDEAHKKEKQHSIKQKTES
jgi:hypothetical protein